MKPQIKLCPNSSQEGYCCTYDEGHGGPCSRVLWSRTGMHKRVFWWPGRPASETLDFVGGPR